MQIYSKVMVFVDGTNFLIELSKHTNVKFRADKPPLTAIKLSHEIFGQFIDTSDNVIIRKYWFSSYQGSDEDFIVLSKELRKYDFEPILFKKHKGKEKGVDIALAKEMLVNSFNQNYDIGYLIAGDADYADLVNEIKRYGQRVSGIFFSHGLSNTLELSFDNFFNINDLLSPYFSSSQYKEIIHELMEELIK